MNSRLLDEYQDNDIVVFKMIPALDSRGLLPPGIHECSWTELDTQFSTNRHRRELLGGLRDALIELKHAGCGRAYIDGSFVTDKRVPGDYDGCWDPVGVDPGKLDPVLWTFDNGRLVIAEDLCLRRLKFSDELLKENDEIPEDELAARLDADFALMSEAVIGLQERLLALFGGEAE